MAALVEGTHEVEVERFTLRGEGGDPVPVIHARPLGVPARGLVVHPDIGGVRPLFDDIARRIATHNIAVCVTEPFARIPDRESMDLDARMATVATLDDAQQLGDLERAADHLVVTDDVTDIAVLGFCMGGMYALKAAATGRFDRAVSFYGMIRVPENWRSDTLAEPLATAASVCPTLAILGADDVFTPEADIQALREAWRERPDCEIVVYPGAEHGFVHDPQRPTHRADDAADAWSRVLRFLGVS